MISALDINYNKITQSDRCRAWAIAVILNADSIRYVFNTLFKHIFPSVLILNLTLILVCWIPVIYSLFKNNEPQRYYNWSIPIIVFFLFLFTLIINPESYNSIVLGCDGSYRAQDLVFSPIHGIVCFYLVSRLTCADAMKYALVLTVIMAFFVNIWQPLVLSRLDVVQTVHSVSTGQDFEVSYSGYFGYGISIVMLFSVLHCVLYKTRRLFFMLLGIICIVELLLWGNRGVFLQLGVLLILYLINAGGISSRKKWARYFLLILIILVSLFIFYNWLPIVLAIKDLGIESRTVESIIEGSLMDSNGREDYQIAVIKMINRNYLGGGVYSSLTEFKFYAHNFFLDLFADFGYIIGGCIILLFIIKIVQAFKRFTNQNYLFPFMIFFSYALGKMMVTNYYMFENYFWACMAIVVVGLKNVPKRQYKDYNWYLC